MGDCIYRVRGIITIEYNVNNTNIYECRFDYIQLVNNDDKIGKCDVHVKWYPGIRNATLILPRSYFFFLVSVFTSFKKIVGEYNDSNKKIMKKRLKKIIIFFSNLNRSRQMAFSL